MQRPSLPRTVLYGLAIVLSITLVIAASTTTATFGTYDGEWDETSDFRELADQRTETTIGFNTRSYETMDPDGTVAIILAPTEAYSTTDSRRVREFVEAGGTVVIADDFGEHSNALLADVGADARFDGAQLRDERSYYRAPSLPVATNVTTSPFTGDTEQLTLNGATAIDSSAATPLVTTTGLAYLDRDDTGSFSSADELNDYPVVTIESVGDGRVISVSDPSIFINSMLAVPDNEAFATALADEHDLMLIDYSRSGSQPPVTVALVLFRSSSVLQIVTGLVGVGVVWAVAYQSREASR